MRKAISNRVIIMGGIRFPKETVFIEVEPSLYYHQDMLGGHSAGGRFIATKYENRLWFEGRAFLFNFKEIPPITLENK